MLYQDFGPIRIPPLPPGLVLADRLDGTPWLLAHDPEGEALELVEAPAGPADLRRHGPFSGPLLRSPAGVLRLYAEGGALDYEIAPLRKQGRADPEVYTRRFPSDRQTRRLFAGDGWRFGDPLDSERLLIPDDFDPESIA